MAYYMSSLPLGLGLDPTISRLQVFALTFFVRLFDKLWFLIRLGVIIKANPRVKLMSAATRQFWGDVAAAAAAHWNPFSGT